MATMEAVRAGSELVAPSFEVKEGLHLYENRYVLPDDKALRLKVLESNHDSRVAGHFVQFKTLDGYGRTFSGPRWRTTSRTMFGAAMSVNETKLADGRSTVCCSRWRFPISPGGLFRWISLLASPSLMGIRRFG